MKKNRNFIMFIIMLIMMTMMATLATRQFPQTYLVDVIEYEENIFVIQNITDERLSFTKRYEVRLSRDGEEDVLVYETTLSETFFIDIGEVYRFEYDFSEHAPEFIQVELAPGLYSLTKIYTFYSGEREQTVSIIGHMFIILP